MQKRNKHGIIWQRGYNYINQTCLLKVMGNSPCNFEVTSSNPTTYHLCLEVRIHLYHFSSIDLRSSIGRHVTCESLKKHITIFNWTLNCSNSLHKCNSILKLTIFSLYITDNFFLHHIPLQVSKFTIYPSLFRKSTTCP